MSEERNMKERVIRKEIDKAVKNVKGKCKGC